jgi:hypothetical protein
LGLIHLQGLAFFPVFHLFLIVVLIFLLLLLLLHAHHELLLLKLKLLLHRQLVFFLLIFFVFNFALLVMLFIDLGNMWAAVVVSDRPHYLLVLFRLIIAHILFLLVLFDGFRHHSAHHTHSRLLLFLPFGLLLIFVLILSLSILLKLLLLILLEHHQVLLRGDVVGAISWEIGGCEIKPIVVLSTEEKLLLLLSEMSVGVKVSFTEDVDILLKFSDLRQVSHECL